MVHRPSKMRARQDTGEAIHIIALWNLMIILIPFLLLSAVFSDTAILNIYLPESPPQEEKKGAADQPVLIVSILKEGFIVNDGETVLAALARTDAGYPFEALSALLLEFKNQMPQNQEILLLSEPETPYETIIQTMDASRETLRVRGGTQERVSLFPNVSLGEVGGLTFREIPGDASGKKEGAP